VVTIIVLLLWASPEFFVRSRFINDSTLDTITRDVDVTLPDTVLARLISERMISYLENYGVINPEINVQIEDSNDERHFIFDVENENIIFFDRASIQIGDKIRSYKWCYKDFLYNGAYLGKKFQETSNFLSTLGVFEVKDYYFAKNEDNEWNFVVVGNRDFSPPVFLCAYEQNVFSAFAKIGMTSLNIYPLKFAFSFNLKGKDFNNLNAEILFPLSISRGLYLKLKGGYGASASFFNVSTGGVSNNVDISANFGWKMGQPFIGFKAALDRKEFRTIINGQYGAALQHLIFMEYEKQGTFSPGFTILKTNIIEKYPFKTGYVSVKLGKPIIELSLKLFGVVLSRTFTNPGSTGLGFSLPISFGNIYFGFSLNDGGDFLRDLNIEFFLFRKSLSFDYLSEFN